MEGGEEKKEDKTPHLRPVGIPPTKYFPPYLPLVLDTYKKSVLLAVL
jgi:hypothetical protein